MSKMNWDVHHKMVIGCHVPELLTMAGIKVPDGLHRCPTDLGTVRRDADVLHASGDLRVVVHVENQQAPDPTMGRRMTAYAMQIAEHPHYRDTLEDVIQVVVQVTGPPMPTTYRLGGVTNSWTQIHLPTLDPRTLLDTAPFAAYAVRSAGAAAVAPLVRQVGQELDPQVRLAMVALAINLEPGLASTIIEELRRADMVDVVEYLSTTDFGRGLIDRGREEGRQEGSHEERETLIRRVLGLRFPAADPVVCAAVASYLVSCHGQDAIDRAMALQSLDDLD